MDEIEIIPDDDIKVLSNGAGYSRSRKRIVHGPGTYGEDPNRITTENAMEYARLRQEATRERIRREITKQTQAQSAGINAAPDAAGYASGVLWSDIVLNGDAPPRDRRQTWLDVSRAAGLLADPRQDSTVPPGGAQINITETAIRAILETTGRSRE